MNDDVARTPSDLVAESVRRALQLVGPAEAGTEHVWEDEPHDTPAA
jgi:hypothetical protein